MGREFRCRMSLGLGGMGMAIAIVIGMWTGKVETKMRKAEGRNTHSRFVRDQE